VFWFGGSLRRDARSILIIYEKFFGSVRASFLVPFGGILRGVIRLNTQAFIRAAAGSHGAGVVT